MLKRKTKKGVAAKPSKLPIPRRVHVDDKSATAKAAKSGKAAREPEPAPGTEAPVEASLPTDDATPTPTPVPSAGKLSCLDAAAEVLRAAGEPMRCRELVAAMAAQGLWASNAPTPHQTLTSALLREIAKKGPASRFRRADRGRFERNHA
jgi:hypothetical protein